MKKSSVLLAALCAVHAAVAVTVSVVAPQEGAAKAVTVGSKASVASTVGKSVQLKATANTGWVFAGWYEEYDSETGIFSSEASLAKSADWRSPSPNYIVGEADTTLYARFVNPADDQLTFDMKMFFSDLAIDFDGPEYDRPILSRTNAVDMTIPFPSASFPTVTITGLPAGLSFDKSSLRLAGTPTESGIYRINVSAKNASGYTFGQIFDVRVANAGSERVQGMDFECVINEEVDASLYDLFAIDPESTVSSISVSGQRTAGLRVEFDSDEGAYYLRGTPSKAGDFQISCTVKFSDGKSETASALLTVNDIDPLDYDVSLDLSGLEGCSVGDILEEQYIGSYDSENKVGVTGVSSLPAGLSLVKEDYGYGIDYYAVGRFTKAGDFAVKVTMSYYDYDADKAKTLSMTKSIIVNDRPGIYLSMHVDPEDATGCKVTGSGVYGIGSTAKLTATAGSSWLFAGWHDGAGMPLAIGGDDYRKSPASIVVEEELEGDCFAVFIPKTEDYVDISMLASEYELNANDDIIFAESFAVNSGSLPTLKFSNLPAGVTCSPSAQAAGEYVLYFDPATAKKKPTPGKYSVTVTATNASRMSDTATFLITVMNYTDEDIDVKEDYGVLTPNVAMTPISFSNAVDFARGDTLAVSGLPTGLKYNDKAAPFCISGVPTKPGSYTLTFTGKIVTDATTNKQGRVTYTYRTGTATAFITVKDFPIISTVLSEGAAEAGNKVTGGGSFKAGTKVTLKATPAKDWVFAGWSGIAGTDGLAALNPSLSYVMGTNDLTEVAATFIHKRDDMLYVDDPGVVAVVKGVSFSTNLIESILGTRSLPTVTVTGLPKGLKFDSKTFLISGSIAKTTKSEYVYVTVAAKNASGYTFTRVLKFYILDAAEDEIPEEPLLDNEAEIDFFDLDTLETGGYYPQGEFDVGAIGFAVNPSATGASVTDVSVSGLPTGLKSATTIEEGEAFVNVFGSPSKPGRYTIKVQVTYSDRKKATSQYAFIVEDGGCGWLEVESISASDGTVSGGGVYSSGASVKLSAKPASGKVFAGWFEDEYMPFAVMSEMDGVDYRTASATFIFRKEMFSATPYVLYGNFMAKADDAIDISGLDDTWEIDPAESSEFEFGIYSDSLPKLTVSGLPKGVTLDAVAGRFVYSSASQAQIAPGYYTVTLKAANQSNKSDAASFQIFVANKTTAAIVGLDPAADAYMFNVGVGLDPAAIMPEVDVANGWKLAASGLPTGLSLKSEKDGAGITRYYVAGVPTKASTNTVTFTATKGKEKEIATVTIGVAALPVWASGTYDGAYFTGEEEATDAVGSVTVTISAAGKVSGKILTGGKTYSFSAASLGGYDLGTSNFTAEVSVPWTKSDNEVFLLAIGEDEYGIGHVTLEPIGDGVKLAEAVQNVWLRKDLSAPDFATGTKQPKLSLASGVECKFGAKGVVTLGGKIGSVTVSGKVQTLAMSGKEGANARVVLYVANTRFEGGAICEILDIELEDTNDDGKLDAVTLK